MSGPGARPDPGRDFRGTFHGSLRPWVDKTGDRLPPPPASHSLRLRAKPLGATTSGRRIEHGERPSPLPGLGCTVGQETTDFLLEHESVDFLDQVRGFPVLGLNRPGATVGLVS